MMTRYKSSPPNYEQLISELVSLILDDDVIVSERAIKTAYLILQSKHKWMVLKFDVPLIRTLIDVALRPNESDSVIKCVLAILNNLFDHPFGPKLLYKYGAIQLAYKCLQSNNDLVTSLSINMLYDMLLRLPMANIAVRKTGGIYYIIELIRRIRASQGTCSTINNHDSRSLALLVSCLRSLAYQNQEAKEMILEHGGTSQLIDLLNTHFCEKLLWITARCIKCLTICSKNKQFMVQCGCVQRLAKCLNESRSKRLTMNLLWSIHNLSYEAASQPDLIDSIRVLIRVTGQTQNMDAIAVASDALINLTSHNPFNKEIVHQLNAVQTLVQTLVIANQSQRVTESVLTVLLNMTNKHAHVEECRNLIFLCDGLTQINRYFYEPFRWSTAEIAIRLIRNLAISQQTHAAFRELNLIQRLGFLLSVCNEHKKLDSSVTLASGVSAQSVIENILFILYILTFNEKNSESLCHSNLIAVCCDLIRYHQPDIVLHLAVNLMTSIIHHPIGIAMIAGEHTMDKHFKKLLSSSDKKVSENVRLIMLNVDRFRNRLDIEC